jgi:hypothetical protein
MIDIEALKRFLAKAHANTYASETAQPLSTERPGFTEYEYSDQAWAYRDSYCGGRRFIGEEVVRFAREGIVWGMNYYGYVVGDSPDMKVIYSFLKKALRVGVEGGIALRGPYTWETEIFKYECDTDRFAEFSGHERIYFKKSIVYEAYYHGGLID